MIRSPRFTTPRPPARSRTAAPAALLALPVFLLAACEAPEPPTPGIVVEDVGFETPESIQWDEVNDWYVVSNINGNPVEKADNGFISRLSPEGEVLDLHWIDGRDEDVTLHAPKGIAFRGDVLWVADIDCVRGFHRETGEPLERLCIEGATFLNGLAVDEERGILYVTDTGMTLENGELVATGTDAVYEDPPDGEVSVLAEGEELGGPNGITWSDRGLIVAAFRSGELYALHPTGEKFQMMEPGDRQLDGLVALPDRGFLVSDWVEGVVFRIHAGGTLSTVLSGIEAPADIGFDAQRGMVLIPLFMDDAVRMIEIELDMEPGM